MEAFVLPVRVYLEDTDAQGVVYNASYFRFMERARTEWLRACGADHETLRARHGVHLVLKSTEAKFLTPARLGDLLQVEAAVVSVRGARVVFEQAIRRERAGAPGGKPGEPGEPGQSGKPSESGEAGGPRAQGEPGASGKPGAGAGAELICRGVAEVACIDVEQGKPRRLPATLVSGLSQ